ncbi:MAG: Xaa-Pro peptidase family protein [Bryobacteraceae bacterium]
MLSRRAFSGLALGITSAGHLFGRRPEEDGLSSTPPAIAALKSRKTEAHPISITERRDRLARARALMSENKIDALCMIGGTSLLYFTGIRWWNSERLFTFVLPQKGKPFYVSPAFEEDRAREQIAQAPEGDESRILTWQEDEDPYRLVARGLGDAGLGTGRIGIEERVTFVFSDGIAKACPNAQIVSGTPVTAGCRMIKSTAEIGLMRLAAQVTLAAYEAAWKSLQPGMTQNEFAQLVAAAHRQLGFDGEASVQVGPYSALPHGSLAPQVIREGAVLLMDGGCKVEGYESDISRTFVLGKPSEKMQRVFQTVHRAQEAALKTARPGVACEKVDAAARKVIADSGYGSGYAHFTHRVGHGLGMDGHEWPYLVRGDTRLLEANMVFSDEPGIYLRGEFGVRLEDDMHIIENGAELFTAQSPSLTEPFARA